MVHSPSRRRAVALLALALPATSLLLVTGADAAVVATVPLATSAQYSVLAGSTVTNTGPTTLGASLGLAPGTSITGFPPGIVVPPGTTNATNPAAAQAKLDLTAAYINAAGRPIDGTTTADLANLHLQGGVYAGPGKGALSLTGPLVLDGAGDPTTVFVFQTNSTLITASGSTVTLVNGAQECNVFWQVGSSATLGTGSTFTGTILALESITVTNGVTVHGRAMARNAAVTLENDTFTAPLCAAQVAPTTTTTSSTSTTLPTTTTTRPATTVTTTPAGPTSTVPVVGSGAPPAGPAAPGEGIDTQTTDLPFTGAPIGRLLVVVAGALLLGALSMAYGRRGRRS
ncbi:MAG: hypothetical protein JWN67_530 [Actinomycetia bacterium]|nr:hypothetical protein [Actinomycetes bacterium]